MNGLPRLRFDVFITNEAVLCMNMYLQLNLKLWLAFIVDQYHIPFTNVNKNLNWLAGFHQNLFSHISSTADV